MSALFSMFDVVVILMAFVIVPGGMENLYI